MFPDLSLKVNLLLAIPTKITRRYVKLLQDWSNDFIVTPEITLPV